MTDSFVNNHCETSFRFASASDILSLSFIATSENDLQYVVRNVYFWDEDIMHNDVKETVKLRWSFQCAEAIAEIVR